jgi:hypothetical protein
MKYIPLKEIAPLSKVAFQNWINGRAPRMGAALAHDIALWLAPTLLILLAIAATQNMIEGLVATGPARQVHRIQRSQDIQTAPVPGGRCRNRIDRYFARFTAATRPG